MFSPYRLPIACILSAFILVAEVSAQQEATPPAEVGVLPVFFVPSGQPMPTDAQKEKLMRHLEWAHARYLEMLDERSTFRVARPEPSVYQAREPLSFYRLQPEGSAPQLTSELLTKLQINRYNCPYIFLIVVMNPADGFPGGGGRPLNGGFNTGGGMLMMSSHDLDKAPNFQSTLQHELGHAFGLPHVDVYGYPLRDGDSIMSYNKAHHTDGLNPSATPGDLIPEDIRGLAFNDRAFPGLFFDEETDLPEGYKLGKIVTLGPMIIPGQSDGITVDTPSGETCNSSVGNIVQGRILPSETDGPIKFDGKTMWHSSKVAQDRAVATLSFPYEVELTRILVYTEHSGSFHRAREVEVAIQGSDGKFQPVISSSLISADDSVTLPGPTRAKVWRLTFLTGETKMLTVRGLRFFSGDDELFPPLVPYSSF